MTDDHCAFRLEGSMVFSPALPSFAQFGPLVSGDSSIVDMVSSAHLQSRVCPWCAKSFLSSQEAQHLLLPVLPQGHKTSGLLGRATR